MRTLVLNTLSSFCGSVVHPVFKPLRQILKLGSHCIVRSRLNHHNDNLINICYRNPQPFAGGNLVETEEIGPAGLEPATPCLEVTRGILPEPTLNHRHCPANPDPAWTTDDDENFRPLKVTRKNVWTRVDVNAFVWTFMWT